VTGDRNGTAGTSKDATGRPSIQDVKELRVWQMATQLCKAVYRTTSSFPKAELYGLTSQMRRAAVAIPSNIAEGRGRGSRKDYRQFVIIARGSACELETQAIIARELGFLSEDASDDVLGQIQDVARMLNGLAAALAE
jgi:four helix bundle protein